MTTSHESSAPDGGDGIIQVTFQDNIGVITMKRGQNRINNKLIDGLNAAFDEVLSNPNAKALITTGLDRFYSNGIDLPWMMYQARTDEDQLKKFFLNFSHLVCRILTFPLPTIALLNGHAFAGGAVLATAHDHVIMQNTRGWWCMNEVHIKLRFTPLLIELMRSKLPRGRALHEALVLGRRFTADEAKEAGIVQESCAPDDMYSRALAWVRKVVPPAGFNREHFQTMKEDVHKNVLEYKDNAQKLKSLL